LKGKAHDLWVTVQQVWDSSCSFLGDYQLLFEEEGAWWEPGRKKQWFVGESQIWNHLGNAFKLSER
jgi:hypothetical protein